MNVIWEAGEVTVEATAGAVDGSSVIFVLDERAAENVTAIDSTRARLVSDSAQIAEGQFEFQITEVARMQRRGL